MHSTPLEQEFLVQIEGDGRGNLHSRVLSAPRHTGAHAPFAPPLPPGEMDSWLGDLGDRLRQEPEEPGAGRGERRVLTAASRPPTDPQRVGEMLFDALMRGAVGAAWTASDEAVRNAGGRLRLRLQFDPSHPDVAAAAALPWELIRERRSGIYFARSPRHGVVRAVARTAAPAPEPTEPPLRILLASAVVAGTPPLELAAEARAVGRIWDAIPGVEVEVVAPVTVEALRQKLGRGGFHVFHFMGHGGFEPGSGRGALRLASEDGTGEWVSAELLADLLDDCRELRLAMINACNTGRLPRRRGVDPFSSIAAALTRRGVAAVVAMQFPISDAAALRFSHAFYRQLAAGQAVDTAATVGRQEIFRTPGGSGEWATPVLYLGPSDPDVLRLGPVLAARRRRRVKALLTSLAAVALLVLGMVTWERYRTSAAVYHRPTDPSDSRCPPPPGLESMSFVLVEAGSFIMGDDAGEADERPAHEVMVLHPFCLSRFELTLGEREALMNDESKIINGGEPPENPELPAAVTWQEAHELVDELNRREDDAPYRLPTDAEWEYAARAGTRTAFSFGDDETALPEYGNCLSGDGRDDRFDHAAPVGSLAANRWGLYDLHGNLWEWVEDLYQAYPGAPEGAAEAADGLRRVKRGGSFKNQPVLCRSSSRNPALPDRNDQAIGLRLVREPLPAAAPGPGQETP